MTDPRSDDHTTLCPADHEDELAILWMGCTKFVKTVHLEFAVKHDAVHCDICPGCDMTMKVFSRRRKRKSLNLWSLPGNPHQMPPPWIVWDCRQVRHTKIQPCSKTDRQKSSLMSVLAGTVDGSHMGHENRSQCDECWRISEFCRNANCTGDDVQHSFNSIQKFFDEIQVAILPQSSRKMGSRFSKSGLWRARHENIKLEDNSKWVKATQCQHPRALMSKNTVERTFHGLEMILGEKMNALWGVQCVERIEWLVMAVWQEDLKGNEWLQQWVAVLMVHKQLCNGPFQNKQVKIPCLSPDLINFAHMGVLWWQCAWSFCSASFHDSCPFTNWKQLCRCRCSNPLLTPLDAMTMRVCIARSHLLFRSPFPKNLIPNGCAAIWKQFWIEEIIASVAQLWQTC